MDAPTAGFLSICVATVGGVALKWVSYMHQKPSTNGNNKEKEEVGCPLHKDVTDRLSQGDARMDAILQLSVAIAAHLKIPIDNIKSELQDVLKGG